MGNELKLPTTLVWAVLCGGGVAAAVACGGHANETAVDPAAGLMCDDASTGDAASDAHVDASCVSTEPPPEV